MTYDDLLKKVDGPKFRWKMIALFFLNGIPNALVVTSLAMVHYIPESYRCSLSPALNSTKLDLLIPYDSKKKSWDQCHRFNVSIHNEKYVNRSTVLFSNKTIPCDNGYTFVNPYGIFSAAMEFDWLCGKSWIKPIVTSLYMVGFLVGCSFGYVADRFGRRWLFIISTHLHLGLLFVGSFIQSSVLYGVFLFLVGLTGSGHYMPAFILANELVVKEHRNYISIAMFVSYALGYGIESFIAYFVRDWRSLWRVLGSLTLVYLINIWMAPASPRWLATTGRIKEAKLVFDRIAKCNKKPCISLEEIEEAAHALTKESEAEKKTKPKTSQIFKEVLKSKIMVLIVFVVFFSWFTVALVYYGISLSVQALSGNLYINNTLMGFVEVPGLIVAFLAVKYLSRPRSHGGLMILSGIFCLGAALLNEVHPIASNIAGLTGKALNSGAFYLVYVHAAELFPTMTRNSFMSMGSFGGRMGSFVSAYIPFLADIYGMYVPYIVMSLLGISSGVFTIFILPETRGQKLPETVQDTTNLKRAYSSIYKAVRRTKRRNNTTDADGKEKETQNSDITQNLI